MKEQRRKGWKLNQGRLMTANRKEAERNLKAEEEKKVKTHEEWRKGGKQTHEKMVTIIEKKREESN